MECRILEKGLREVQILKDAGTSSASKEAKIYQKAIEDALQISTIRHIAREEIKKELGA